MQNFRYGQNQKNNSGNGSFRSSKRRPFRRSNSGNRFNHQTRGEHIDVARFVKKAVSPQAQTSVVINNSFSDFGFCQNINQILISIGYTSPTPIQDQSIKHIMDGRDLVGLANTGTGKTAAFLLPLINKCYADKSQKVLIIAPTRELAQQIDEEFRRFSRNMNLYSAVCVGGVPSRRQISSLRRNPNFVIGTPGRLKDLKNKSVLKFSIFQNIVLDEIDRMLDMGFVEEIKRVLSELPEKRQSLFFSATIPAKIELLVQQFLHNPVTIKASTGTTAANVDQDIVRVENSKKYDRLMDILLKEDSKKVLIFSETKRDVERLAKELTISGFKADSIHGDKRQSQRQRALLSFREDHIQVLVATDVAARGLDVNNISHVINYTIPHTYDDYVHRIGRTGRGDKTGVALTFVG